MGSFAQHTSLATFILASACASTAFAAGDHDGKWVVSVMAEAGACKARRTVPIHVVQGRVTYAGLFSAEAKGQVHATGELNVVFSHRDQVVNASGILSEQLGRGSWKSPTKDCSGSWIARKG